MCRFGAPGNQTGPRLPPPLPRLPGPDGGARAAHLAWVALAGSLWAAACALVLVYVLRPSAARAPLLVLVPIAFGIWVGARMVRRRIRLAAR